MQGLLFWRINNLGVCVLVCVCVNGIEKNGDSILCFSTVFVQIIGCLFKRN